MNNGTNPKIAVALRLDIMPGRQHLLGFLRYMREMSKRWNLSIVSSANCSREGQFATDDLDGLVVSEHLGQGLSPQFIGTTIPIVAIDAPVTVLNYSRKNLVHLRLNDRELCKNGAEYLFSKGKPGSCLFCRDDRKSPWARRRERAFCGVARQKQTPCVACDINDKQVLMDTIRILPQPIAIMTACDRILPTVLESCKELELKIPDQVLLLGIDDDELYCSQLNPTISSIDPNLEYEGYRAAAELDKMLQRKAPCRAKTVFIKSHRIVERESTSFIPPSVLLANRAVSIINANFRHQISIKDIATGLSISRRLLDLRFRQVLGKSILDYIMDLRFELLCKKLKGADQPLKTLTSTCGFSSQRAVEVQFRKRYGVSMSEWQKRNATAQPLG